MFDDRAQGVTPVRWSDAPLTAAAAAAAGPQWSGGESLTWGIFCPSLGDFPTLKGTEKKKK